MLLVKGGNDFLRLLQLIGGENPSLLLIPLIHFLSHQTEPVPQQEIRNKT